MAIVYVLGAILVIAVILVIVGIRTPDSGDPIQQRLAEFAVRDEPMTLQEIELSTHFHDRIILPFFNRIGRFASRFTPQATIEATRHRLDMAGNPMQMDPAFFLAMRFIVAALFGGLIFLSFVMSGRGILNGLAVGVIFLLIGFVFPELWLSGRISRRQREIFRSMPDALDLLTVCVQAGLGFDAAMDKVHEKWDDDLAIEFGRVIQEIRLGKLRREALRDMADRLGVAEMTSFVAAVIQSEQLGVSMSKVLRIQSDQMRVRRRQMAEEEAHKLPVKMVFPIGILIFPSLLIVLLGPAILTMLESPMGAILGF
jgi:tight adherence protein C